jgi:hypothetical protein
VDASDALAVAADFEAAAAEIVTRTRSAVSEAATAARDAMRVDMGGSGSFGHAADSITFDLVGDGAEIGPTKPTGAIANIAYFGGSNGGGGTVRDPLDAAESTDLESAFQKILDGLL